MVDGLFLNSPFFDFNAPWLVRRPLCRIGRADERPVAVPRSCRWGSPACTARACTPSIAANGRTTCAWKPLGGFPVRTGWLEAIRRGQRRLRAGLAIDVPVLLACSTRTFRGTRWHEGVRLADAVLDVEHMVRWAPRLGRHVTIARFDGGMHDLTLSGEKVRAEVFYELGRWTEGFMPSPAKTLPSVDDAATPAS